MCEIKVNTISRRDLDFPSFVHIIGIPLRVIGRQDLSIHGGRVSPDGETEEDKEPEKREGKMTLQ